MVKSYIENIISRKLRIILQSGQIENEYQIRNLFV